MEGMQAAELNYLGSLILTLLKISSVTLVKALNFSKPQILICEEGIILHRVATEIKFHNTCLSCDKGV